MLYVFCYSVFGNMHTNPHFAANDSANRNKKQERSGTSAGRVRCAHNEIPCGNEILPRNMCNTAVMLATHYNGKAKPCRLGSSFFHFFICENDNFHPNTPYKKTHDYLLKLHKND